MYLYFSTGNGQLRKPALCQLYRHTFVPYSSVADRQADRRTPRNIKMLLSSVECSSSDVTVRERQFKCIHHLHINFRLARPGWLGSRVVSVLDSGAEGPGFKLQSRRCRVTVLGKLFSPIVPLFTKQRN